jgi:hypothetical protein
VSAPRCRSAMLPNTSPLSFGPEATSRTNHR